MPAKASIGVIERVLFLRRLSHLAGLPDSEVMAVAEYCRERRFAKGALLLRDGEALESLYIPLAGRVGVSRRGRFLGEVGPGAVIGAQIVLSRDVYGLEATAASEVEALELDAEVMLDILEDHFSLVQRGIKSAARENLELAERFGESSDRFPPIEVEPFRFRDFDFIDRLRILRAAGPFQRSSIDALVDLARSMAPVVFEPGVTVWQQGDPASRQLLVVTGTVTCSSIRPDGESAFQALPGFPLGVMESFAGEAYRFTAVTETRVTALAVEAYAVMDIFEDNFEVAMDFMAWMGQRTLDLIEHRDGSDAALLAFLTEG
jgi:CRP-like cAMP-binding protein